MAGKYLISSRLFPFPGLLLAIFFYRFLNPILHDEKHLLVVRYVLINNLIVDRED